MTNILIGGYYGAGNLGDEAILECMLKDFRTLRADLSFIVTSWNPSQTSKQHNVQAIHWKDIPALMKAGQQASLIILGGGGLFQDYWGLDTVTYFRSTFSDITLYGSLPLLAQLLGKPCMIYAVGLGPFKSTEALHHTRFAFENCQASTLRDSYSLEILRTSGYFNENSFPIPQVLADPVFTLTTDEGDDDLVNGLLQTNKIDTQGNLIAVVLRYWDMDGLSMGWLENVAAGLNKFLAENTSFHVILLSFQNNELSAFTNDGAINKYFQQFDIHHRYHWIQDQITPRIAQALIMKCDIVLGMRLHSLIMGINASTPVVGISYDPKVTSLMKTAGLIKYCCANFPPKTADVNAKLELAWKNRKPITAKLIHFQELSMRAAKENTRIALELISESPPSPRSFAQQFPIEQIKIVNNLDSMLEITSSKNSELLSQLKSLQAELKKTVKDKQIANLKLNNTIDELEKSRRDKIIVQNHLEKTSDELEKKIREKQLIQINNEMIEGELKEKSYELANIRSQLDKIYSSKFWKLASLYYSLINSIKASKSSSKSGGVSHSLPPLPTGKFLKTITNILNNQALKGIFIVTSAVPFDEFYNQRVINLSKYLSKNGYGVIFVAWRWTSSSDIIGNKLEVFKNVFQIPIDLFLGELIALNEVNHTKKFFIVEFPHPDLFSAALQLRKHNFILVYEIIDDWESFHAEGQAIWFDSEIEKSLVLNANFLTAVSPPLVKKFSNIRRDITLIPNGYDPNLLGKKNANISRVRYSSSGINIGYFGHLTDSWFDWGFLYKILELSEEKGINIKFHLIGYGEPDLKNTAKFKGKLFFYGRVDPSKLYRHAKNWNLAIIPFKSGKLAESVDPIKLYEYLFFGLPIIVKGISHLDNHPFVKLVSTEAQFFEAINLMESIAQNRDGNNDLTKVIAETTWEKRFAKLIQCLESDSWMFL